MSQAFDLTILEPHWSRLHGLLDTGGAEASAYALLGRATIGADPWTGSPRTRLVSHEIHPIADAEKISASPVHVTWATGGFMRLLSEAMCADLVPALIHTHPGSSAFFSKQDNANEAELARTAGIKGVRGLVSIVLGGDGSVCARIWLPDGTRVDMAHIQVVGGRLRRWGGPTAGDGAIEHLDRQARLFGSGFNPLVRSLQVGVIGCGGTGSPVAMMLARLGVGHLLLVDDDTVEVTNLNRVHGSRRSDVGVPKVDVLEREIVAADLGVRVAKWKGWANDSGARDALRSCDVILGCTDDNAGRVLINRLAYFYGIPVIDVGLRMRARSVDASFDIHGRVTTLVPGRPCLICGGFINPRRAAEEALERTDPAEFKRRKAEAYVEGGGDPAPAVVTFTTEMAAVAVNEVLALLTGFHGDGGMVPTRYRRFHLRDDRFLGVASKPGCPVCETEWSWGRGDIQPFLDLVG
ncbi:ThiF family adenylyltransferase [Pararoseomonas baculiformis]|nr:ThiF family adenylyltransferase [Pararoseomonas baculiformis]